MMMESISISEFKAKCIGMLKKVATEHEPLTVTHRGKPLTEIHPVSATAGKKIGGQPGAFDSACLSSSHLIPSDLESDWDE